jgi:hypothetical protein
MLQGCVSDLLIGQDRRLVCGGARRLLKNALKKLLLVGRRLVVVDA